MVEPIQVVLTLIDETLGAEKLQAEVEQLLPQLQDMDGVDQAQLPTTIAPDGSKAFGAFIPGAIQLMVDNSNILQGLIWVGDRLFNGKTLKLKVKAANGSELEVEAKSREDLEYQVQQAIAFCEQNQ